jgi:large subunit ribosomal protein L21
MYAIVQIGSGQYRVSKGDIIRVDRIDNQKAKTVNLDKIVLICDEKKEISVGKPFIKGAKVSAEVLRQFDGKKITAFKYKRRKHYFRKRGHRQLLTELKIKDIS